MNHHGRRCFCAICPFCYSGTRSGWDYAIAGPFKKLWWHSFYCAVCGSRWGAWHWLEERTGVTWRRVYAVAPGTKDADITHRFVAMKRAYQRSYQGNDGPGGDRAPDVQEAQA